MKRIIAIGGTHAETLAFTRQLELKNVRHVVNKDSIRGLRADEVHLLPGYFTRRDRHAINAELRHMSRRSPQLATFTWVKIDTRFVEEREFVDIDTYKDTIGPAMAAQDAKIAETETIAVALDEDEVIVDDAESEAGPEEAKIEAEIAPFSETDDFFSFIEKPEAS